MVILADKGQKSPALTVINAIKSIENEMNEVEEQRPRERPKQIYIQHFSMDLHCTMKRNSGRIVGLYDEVSLLYEQLTGHRWTKRRCFSSQMHRHGGEISGRNIVP